MQPSMRISPSAPSKSASFRDTANSLGVHDTLQYGPRSIAAETKSSNNNLEHRLIHWDETQDNLKLTMLRDVHGLHVPARLLMERKTVSMHPHMPAMRRSNIHLDILMGRDETLDPPDFFLGMEHGPSFSLHSEMEKKLRM
ncbi:proteasome maturation factor UMP1-domain-containing protein [Scleroderma yunnanense]